MEAAEGSSSFLGVGICSANRQHGCRLYHRVHRGRWSGWSRAEPRQEVAFGSAYTRRTCGIAPYPQLETATSGRRLTISKKRNFLYSKLLTKILCHIIWEKIVNASLAYGYLRLGYNIYRTVPIARWALLLLQHAIQPHLVENSIFPVRTLTFTAGCR